MVGGGRRRVGGGGGDPTGPGRGWGLNLSAGRGEGWVLAYTCEGRRLWPALHIRSLSLWSLLFCVKVDGVGAMSVPARNSVVSWRAVCGFRSDIQMTVNNIK